jgi:hypothetical protein
MGCEGVERGRRYLSVTSEVGLSGLQIWNESVIEDGIQIIRLSSWRDFYELITQHDLDHSEFIWRGQRTASWPLQSSLDRFIVTEDPRDRMKLARQHLSRFKLASRGRRGNTPSLISSESEWWALAQHNAMMTPLLDWTDSPFVALYFAFEKDVNGVATERAVWGLADTLSKNREIEEAPEGHLRAPLEFFRPMQDENARLVSQAGLFTKLPLGITVEQWIKENYKNETKQVSLMKIVIPDLNREECLRTLNRMNINHLSLFPDLYGAGKHCNKALEISKYSALNAGSDMDDDD